MPSQSKFFQEGRTKTGCWKQICQVRVADAHSGVVTTGRAFLALWSPGSVGPVRPGMVGSTWGGAWVGDGGAGPGGGASTSVLMVEEQGNFRAEFGVTQMCAKRLQKETRGGSSRYPLWCRLGLGSVPTLTPGGLCHPFCLT